MSIPLACPQCNAQYNLKDEMAGLTLRCRQCQGILKVPSAGFQEGMAAAPLSQPVPPPRPAEPAVRSGPPPMPRAREDDEEFGRPRRRADDDDRDYDDRDDDEQGWDNLDPAFQRDKFLLRQKHWSINQKYLVQDEDGRTVLFVERPLHLGQGCLAAFVGIMGMLGVIGLFLGIGFGLRAAVGNQNELFPILFGVLGLFLSVVVLIVLILWLAPKRHIQFYADESKRELLLEILQDKKFAPINHTYTVIDPDGKVLARFRKNYLYNFFRKRWWGYYPNGDDMLLAMEDSLILSLLRRFIGPLFGILRTNFIITKPDGESILGEFNRKFTLLDRYVLDMSRDRRGYVDRRIAIALGVLLDTGEHR